MIEIIILVIYLLGVIISGKVTFFVTKDVFLNTKYDYDGYAFGTSGHLITTVMVAVLWPLIAVMLYWEFILALICAIIVGNICADIFLNYLSKVII